MIKCLIYLAMLSAVIFVVGRLCPKEIFHADSFPFRTLKFERDGKIYEKLRVKSWQNKVPDMSRIVPMFMPRKALDGDYISRLPLLITETCVAELTHIVGALLGFVCVLLWSGAGGIVCAVLYAIGHLPYIIIQRYNRPRLIRLRRIADSKEGGGQVEVSLEGISSR